MAGSMNPDRVKLVDLLARLRDHMEDFSPWHAGFLRSLIQEEARPNNLQERPKLSGRQVAILAEMAERAGEPMPSFTWIDWRQCLTNWRGSRHPPVD